MVGDNDGVLTGGGQNEALKQNLGIDKCGKKDEPFDGLWVVKKRKNTRWQILASVSTGQSTPPGIITSVDTQYVVHLLVSVLRTTYYFTYGRSTYCSSVDAAGGLKISLKWCSEGPLACGRVLTPYGHSVPND